MTGIREIKRLTDERLIEVSRIVGGGGPSLLEEIEEEGSLRVSFNGYKKERANDSEILSTNIRRPPIGQELWNRMG